MASICQIITQVTQEVKTFKNINDRMFRNGFRQWNFTGMQNVQWSFYVRGAVMRTYERDDHYPICSNMLYSHL